MAIPYLPEEILQQIFLRMPTKPLVRLKCLSKQWNRIISDPLFMKSRSRQMIFLSNIPYDAIQNAFHAIDNTGDPSMIKLHFPFKNLKGELEIIIVGSINGILLLVIKTPLMLCLDKHQMMLYNPFSGEFKAVPNPRRVSSCKNCVYGFGYATNIDDLKIVKITNYSSVSRSSYEVFDLKSGSWSEPLELIKDYCVFGLYGVFANGFLYWFAEKKTCRSRRILLVLDIKNMIFSDIEYPSGHWSAHLDTYNGRLCIICYQNKERSELWVMNEYGLEKSWSKVCSFKSVFIVEVLCVLDDGKLLMLKGYPKQLVVYDMFKDLYKELNALRRFGQVIRLNVIKYIESSVSPSDICSSSSSLPRHM